MIKGIVRDIIQPVVGRVLNHGSSGSPSWKPRYYVSNIGNDALDGLSPLNAWRTIAKVNATAFVAGDKIGFKRGDTWAETLTIPSSGTNGNPITFGAYGTGAIPIFNKTTAKGIIIGAISDIVIQDINLTNTGTSNNGVNIYGGGIWQRIILRRLVLSSVTDYNIINNVYSCTNITIDSINFTATGSQAIRLTAAGNSDITISNIVGLLGGAGSMINISTCVNLTLNNIAWTGGASVIGLTTISGLLSLSNISHSGATNNAMVLTSCTATLTANLLSVTNGSTIGLYFVTSAFGAGSTISNSTFTNCGSGGIRINGSTNLLFTNVNSLSSTAGNGFYILGAWSTLNFTNCLSDSNKLRGWEFAGTGSVATLTRCVANLNLGDGFNLQQGSTVHDVTCNYCTASNNGITTNTAEGDGFTCHDAIYNFNINYCIAFGNKQSGLAMIGTTSGTVYNSVFYNNGGAWNTLLGGANLNSIRGNIYIGTTGINATTGKSWTIKNCISKGGYPVEINTLAVARYNEMVFDYNCYYHPSDNNFATLDNLGSLITWNTYHVTNGYEGNSIYDDPLFVDAVNGDFHLQAGSPCINAGVDVGLTSDYDGDPIVGLPDIGAYEK